MQWTKSAVKESKLIEKIDARNNLNKQKQKQAVKDAESLNKLDSIIDNL